MTNDIMDSLATIRRAFKLSRLEPPTAILLGTNDEGMRFLSAIRDRGDWVALVGSPELGHLVEMADGSAWMELKVMGMAVRWPANRYAMPDGTWRYA